MKSGKGVHFQRGLALIVLLVSLVYAQTLRFDFVALDDHHYVSENPHMRSGLTMSSFLWAWSSIYFCWWHPLTWLSHLIDSSFFGLWPGGHHLTSVIVYCAGGVALGSLCRRLGLSVPMSLWVTAMVMLHPARAESVAWVSERKDVLSFLFGTLSTIGWVEFRRGGPRAWYLFSLLTYLLSLLSKSALVTLPVMLIVGELWWVGSRRRVNLWSVTVRLAPFFAAAVCVGLVTVYAQREGKAVVPLELFSVTDRVGLVAVSYVLYLWKTVWPMNLCVLTPRESMSYLSYAAAIAALALIVITLVYFRRRLRHLGYGTLLFALALAPTVGIVAVGASLVSDRYMYIPHVPFFLGVARLMPTVLTSLRKPVVRLLAVVLVVWCSVVSYFQVSTWRDSEALFSHAIDVLPPNYLMQSALGSYYLAEQRLDEALPLLRASTPYDPAAQAALGLILVQRHEDDEALWQARRALSRGPELTGVQWGASQVFGIVGSREARAGRLDRAVPLLEESLAADPTNDMSLTLLTRARADLALEAKKASP